MRLPYFESAVGKSLVVAVWLAISAGVSALIVGLVPALQAGDFAWVAPFVNLALVAIKNLADRQVDNY